ncbi:MAG: ABC transporter ATP-binding protein [Candidatus Methanofastidiosum sp.]|nr:ABC transporter ATP-binding protein [Methanofastidiosum sp.]
MKGIIQDKTKTLWQVIKFFYSRYTKDVLIRDGLFIIVTIAEMLGITVAGKFLDATVKVIKEFEGFDINQYVASDSFYYLCISLLLGIFVIIGTKVRINLRNNITDKVWRDTNVEMINKISKSNLQDIEKPILQNLMEYIPNYSINNLLNSYESFSTIVYQLARGVTAFIILSSHLGWSVLLLALFVLPEVLLCHFNRKLIQIYDDKKMGVLKLTNYIYYTLSVDIRNFNELRVDNTYDSLKKKFYNAKSGYLKGLFHRRKHFTIDETLGAVAGQLFKYGYIVYLLGYAVINKITIGTFSALFNYVDVVFNSAFHIFNTFALLDNYLSYTSKYFDFVNYRGFGDERHGYERLPRKKTPDIEFLNFDFAYPDEPDKKVLENISLKIRAGEKVAFFGRDGSGKSSLIKILTGLYQVTSGDYVMGGYSVRELDRGEVKSKIAATFQNFVNYSFSIRENITLTGENKKINRDLYNRVIKVCEIDKFMKAEGISDTLKLGKYLDGKELSPGYWQRLAIARMLYRNRDIFILDEPFTFIDAPSREVIMKNIFRFAGPDRTVILITRDTDLLDVFDHIFVFSNGHIVENGNWNELIKKKGRFYKEVRYNQ